MNDEQLEQNPQHQQADPELEPGTSRQKDEDFGFGSKIGSASTRLINPDGSYNVRKMGTGLGAINPYQLLITMPWWKFWLTTLAAYVLVNGMFALLYMVAGVEQLTGFPPEARGNFGLQFANAFFFSVQTFTSVGYGATSPVGLTVNIIASFEAMVGLLGFALATGVLFGRFARPSAKIAFSKNAIVAPYQDINGLMFRIVNRRKNQLINMKIQVVMMGFEQTSKGPKQIFHRLELERDEVTLFPLSWTIVHPMGKESPLYGYTPERMLAEHAEFLIVIQAYDETFAQEVHQRMSYRYDELLWGAKFKKIFGPNEEGVVVIEVDKVSMCERAELNAY